MRGTGEDQCRRWLSAFALLDRCVPANLPRLHRTEKCFYPSIYRLHLIAIQQSATDPTLVRDHADRHSRLTEASHRGAGAGHESYTFGVAVVGDVHHERAISVEQHAVDPR